MIEDVKRDVALWLGSNVPTLSGKIVSAFPDAVRLAPPSATVDIVGGYGGTDLQTNTTDLLVRIAIISDDVQEIDSLTDDMVDDALKNHSIDFTTVYYGGIHDISPVMEAFIEKEKFKVFVREFDLKFRHVMKR